MAADTGTAMAKKIRVTGTKIRFMQCAVILLTKFLFMASPLSKGHNIFN